MIGYHTDESLSLGRSRGLLWVCLITFAVFVGWAGWATLDEMTRGEGRIVPSGRLQSIQSLEGGILEALYVNEGDVVEKGQPILKLDDTRFRSLFLETDQQIKSLKAAITRLEAEVTGVRQLGFTASDSLDPQLIETETRLFEARRAKLDETVASLTRRRDLGRQQLRMLEPLVRDQAVSEMEFLTLKKEVASVEGELVDVVRAFSQEAYTELSGKKTELSRLEQVALQRADQLTRTIIRSPVRGRVNSIAVTTQGGVIQPGDEIMDILPTDDHLLVEARIRPQDVAFIAPGMNAVVKLTAYDYTVYGSLDGEVLQVSADTIEEETPRGKETFYKVLIQTAADRLAHRGQELPMKPGMVAQVEIKTAKRNVLSYLMRPILKARLI